MLLARIIIIKKTLEISMGIRGEKGEGLDKCRGGREENSIRIF